MRKHPIKLINNHIIIDDEQHLILDSGSPLSFHSSGVINVTGEDIPVKTAITGICSDYLSSNVGTTIDGLIGMDIINRYPLLVDARGGYIIVNDDAVYTPALKKYDLGPLGQGLIAVELLVNNRPVRMIVDTGAPISYINASNVEGLECEGEVNGFHPLIGEFHSDIYRCEVVPMNGEAPYSQMFGVLPNLLMMTLAMLQVDGIIGVDLFKKYRIQIRNGQLFLPTL